MPCAARHRSPLYFLCLAATVLTVLAVDAPAFADEPNQAGLVVQLSDGQVLARCVPFEADELSGAELLAQSGLEVVVDPASSMGVTVCQIEGVGCGFPAEPCFCQCLGGGTCTYWNYYYRDPGQAEWVYSAMGAALHKVRAGSVEAWVWGQGQAPPPEELSFEAICAPPTVALTATPPPPAPTAAVLGAAASTSPAPTQPPAVLPAATHPLPTPLATPAASTGPDLRSYWPFGLMVVGLALVGLIVWRRRA